MEIKDYLHLYLGCQVRVEGHPDCILGAVGIKDGEMAILRWGVCENMEWCYADADEIKILLRPLSHATMQEKADAKHLIRIDKWGQQTVESMAAVTKFLLSKGFDLFGLIDAGLAVDKETLPQQY